jgi:hypothetical protein
MNCQGINTSGITSMTPRNSFQCHCHTKLISNLSNKRYMTSLPIVLRKKVVRITSRDYPHTNACNYPNYQ